MHTSGRGPAPPWRLASQHARQAARRATQAVALAAAVVIAPAAQAHDTWFERAPSSAAGELQLLLGTGTRYPQAEDPVGVRSITASGCQAASGAESALDAVRLGRRQMLLRSVGLDAQQFSCWAQLQPFEIEIQPATVQVYFDEINASPALRSTWDRMHSQGQPFLERYVKVARIDGAAAPPRNAARLPIDLLRIAPAGPLKAGAEARFELRRDGQPLPGLPLELQNGQTGEGQWLRTNDAGQVTARLGAAGRWLLRGVDLRPPAQEGQRWQSRFIAYSFDVVP